MSAPADYAEMMKSMADERTKEGKQMKSTITAKQRKAILGYVTTHTLPAGLGSKESACSIAAINLALTGELTDKVPECMSRIIGKWIIGVQDKMPDEMRNSTEWKRLLPLAAGTGRDLEKERLAVILDWMWSTVLTTLQPIADKDGYGTEWLAMTTERTNAAAASTANAAYAAYAAYAAATNAAHAAYTANAATTASANAASTAAYAAHAASAAASTANAAAATNAAHAAYTAHAAYANAWKTFDPAGLLKRLVEVSQ